MVYPVFCPPIALSSVFAFGPAGDGAVLVQRSDENGGDRTYENVADLERDFADGSLHPGDLKAAVANVMVRVLGQLGEGIKGDKEATKAAKDLKAFEKKLSKMKK
jgi:tyrosyl-tRNA synthetase